MSVVTISREFASVSDDIGESIAQALGYHFVDKAFIGALLTQYGLPTFDREYETIPRFWEAFDAQRGERRDLMVDMLNKVVRAVARHGNVVIQGRSGYAILAGFDDVLHVRLQAPLSVRVGQVMSQRGMTVEAASAAVKDGDRTRRSFVDSAYGVPWDAMQSFDLVVSTEKVSADLIRAWVVDAVRTLSLQPPPDRSVSSIEVDAILAQTVNDSFGCQVDHGREPRFPEV